MRAVLRHRPIGYVALCSDRAGGPATGLSALATRLNDIVGLHRSHSSAVAGVLLASGLALFAGMTVLAWAEHRLGLAVVLLIGLGAVLVLSPTWFLHYSGLTAPPAAIIFGAAAQR